MSVETEQTAPESNDTKSNAISNDAIATRHLRIVLESIADDKNISEEDRKRKIANFGVLLSRDLSAKPLPLNDKKPVTQSTSVTSVAPPVSSSQPKVDKKQKKKKSAEDKKKELIRAAVLANEEKRKKKRSVSVKEVSKEPEATPIVSSPAQAPAPAVGPLPQQPKPEKKMTPPIVSKPDVKVQKETLASATAQPPRAQPETSSAAVITLGSMSKKQSKNKKKGWLLKKLKGQKNTDETRGDMNISEVGAKARVESRDLRSESPVPDEGSLYEDTHFPVTATYIPTSDDGYIMGAPSHESGATDNTIGTFERDYINDIVRDQEESNTLTALSEGTFEQDARALNALSEGTFEQDARAMEAEAEPHVSSLFVPQQVPQRVVGEMPNLSETTFEQDAATRDGDYVNYEAVRMQGSELSNGSCGSETTFERDMRRQATAQASQSVHAQVFATPSLESVTTFEKEARGRMAVAARSSSFAKVDDYAETNSTDASECSLNDHFRQDFQDKRPEPKPAMEWETAAAPHPMPKITELQMQLSPDSQSKKSLGTRIINKFTCHCA